MNLVKTFSSNYVPRELCRKIKGEFYEINKDCFRIDGKWHRINNGLITKDYSLGNYLKIKDAINTLKFGIVDVENNIPIVGYFSENSTLSVAITKCINKGQIYFQTLDNKIIEGEQFSAQELRRLDRLHTPWILCRNEEVLKKLGNNYEYGYQDNLLYPKIDKLKNSKFTIGLGQGYGGLNYGSDNSLNSAINMYNKLNKDLPTKEHKFISNNLHNHSFGLEFETRNGFISTPLLNKYGLIAVRDGSLRTEDGKEPYEFVTIPFKGAKGISTLDNICTLLSDRTKFDQKCSLHVHLGNVPYDEMFIISFVKLIGMIQNELLSLFPLYKTTPEIINSKNYCQVLPKNILPKTISNFKQLNKEEYHEYISYNFGKIYHFVSDGKYPDKNYNRKILEHPINKPKWYINSRYYLVNLVPLIFKNFRTIEFRLHTPTNNRYKVFNWLLIISAIVKFAENHVNKVITNNSISLETIINTIYGDSIPSLMNYINFRKEAFKNENDPLGILERKHDKEYKQENYAK